MKDAMTNVDVAAWAAELAPILVGARLDKAFQPGRDQVLLRFRRKGVGRLDVLFQLGRFVTVTRNPPENPDRPSMVAKILRSDYGNARLVGLRQIGFDRLLRLDFERGEGRLSLVLEIFGEGNMLLLDGEDVIRLPMRGAEHGVRRLKRGELYQPPPGGMDPFALDAVALQERSGDAKRDLVRFLALDVGFGPLWAEELCLRARVDKKVRPQELPKDAWVRIHDAIQELGRTIGRGDLTPSVVYDRQGAVVDAVPFEMMRYPSPDWSHEEAGSFSEALDTFFVGGGDGEDESEDPRRTRFEEAKGKLERQVSQMEEAIRGFEEDEVARRADGELLYTCFQEVQAILDQLHAARRTRSWQDVAAVLHDARERGDEAAKRIRELRPHDATARLRLTALDGSQHEVEVDLRRSVQENADAHYDAAKKAKSRQDGAKKALGEARKRLMDLVDKGLDAFGAAPVKKAGPSRHFWFESYRWTITPGGLVAVGGRSAAQNDAVVKKYLRDGDRYVHAEIHGAPSVVVRTPDGAPRDAGEEDLRSACHFAACASRAWRQFGQASAYWVTPQQVSKTPRSGEFVPRGAWIIHGKRNVVDKLPMRWALGVVSFNMGGAPIPILERASSVSKTVTKIVGGPPESLAPYTEALLEMEPGDEEPNDAAVRIAESVGVAVEDVQAVLPPGPVRLLGDPSLLADQVDESLAAASMGSGDGGEEE